MQNRDFYLVMSKKNCNFVQLLNHTTLMEEKRTYKKMPSQIIEGKLRVKELLKERGMNITQLAEQIGANREVVSRALTGNPTYSLLANIASALNVDVRDLFVIDQDEAQLQGLIVYNGKSYFINNLDDWKNLVDIIK